jgi:hypothetical protein
LFLLLEVDERNFFTHRFMLKSDVMKQLRVLSICVLVVFLVMIGGDLMAQCPMCRMSAESNMAAGGTAGKGLNKGIMYLFFTPYLVIGTLVFLWYKNRKKVDEESMV